MLKWLDVLRDVETGVRNIAIGFVRGVIKRGLSILEAADILLAGGLELPAQDLADQYEGAAQQIGVLGEIRSLDADYIIPVSDHIQTHLNIPDAFVYEVKIGFVDVEGVEEYKDYYVGSNQRLSTNEILEGADQVAEGSPVEGSIAYRVEEIVSAWKK